MKTLLLPWLATLAGLLRSRALLHLEILALRQQLAMITNRDRRRVRLRLRERLFWLWLYRIWPGCLKTLAIFKPDTLVRWHQQGFKLYWRYRSRRGKPGRPKIDMALQDLIRRLSRENPLWGAPRVQSELTLLGYQVAQSTVAKYMRRRGQPPSQSWRTFLKNHVGTLASVDFFTVPTATFRVLYCFVVLCHERRRVVHFNVTAHPSERWTAQQLIEAFPFDEAPKYIIRDRDRIFGDYFRRRVKGMGIEEVPTAPRSP